MNKNIQFQWVNHASYIVKCQDICLITDPWLFGSAFDDGWDLLVETKFELEEFKNITHIWFSHEHPDHFSPTVLKKIPEEIRRDITVLFQETIDKRVFNFCKGLSFNVIELLNKRKYYLNKNFSVICGKLKDEDIDSWLLTEINGIKILNLNDCCFDSIRKCDSIKHITKKVDILLTQFSYANWAGNPQDVEIRKSAALNKFQSIKLQAECFHPQHIVPFASFIYFSHEENRYLNDHINTIEATNDFIKKETKSIPIILYPGDEWDCVSFFCNKVGLDKYKENYQKIFFLPYRKSLNALSQKYLIDLSKKYIRDLKEKNSMLVITLMSLLGLLPRKITIMLTDIKSCYIFNLSNGLKQVPSTKSKTLPDVFLSSHCLRQILTLPWGIETVLVNGRFRVKSLESRLKFYRIFCIMLKNNSGRYYSFYYAISKIIIRPNGLPPEYWTWY